MRIGVITFHASHNYGSMLQAWALQTYLEKQGHKVDIVNYRSKIQRSIYHKPISISRGDVELASVKRLLFYPQSIQPLYKKWHLFEDFLADELKTSDEFRSTEQLSALNNRYDLLICGSDQLWNTNAPDNGVAYFGNWYTGRKISFAASLGPEPEKCNRVFLHQQIYGFEAVSLREQRSLDFLLQNGIIQNGCVVCDPTLLLDAQDYDSIVADEPLIKGDYVFFYTPVGLHHAYFDIGSGIGREMDCKVVTDKAYYPKDIKKYGNIESYIPTGPKEFLNLIRHAKCVCGGSFHLQVFSVLFHKNFYCINGDKDSRTNNLLSVLGLKDRIISLESPHSKAPLEITDYDCVYERLNNYRQTSIAFLQETTQEGKGQWASDK